ncbi:Non-specific lipid-transfer protein 2B [Acorus calamus]|uniref:Non-specific lipid-transfer protein n=1 Tax=Acorus calamus TaxID=4465 RepID=A0AAV9F7V0_ACOCL|nr:Non-specific lipid-transfer protein 2B [Acorus calamus]
MARTIATLAILAIAALLLVEGPREVEAAISCGQVVKYISPCIAYAQKGGAISPGCCSGIRGLNSAARTTPDRQQACSCLKSIARGANPSYARSIPSKCGINIPYSISPNIDCTK